MKKLQLGWFALSVHGFSLQAVDGSEGYTILRLPNKEEEIAVGSTKEVPKNTKDKDKAIISEEFLLWETTSGA